jgi:hypothetical protein
MALVFGFAGCETDGGDDDGGGGTDTTNYGFTNIENVYAYWSIVGYSEAYELDESASPMTFKHWSTAHYDLKPDHTGTFTVSGSNATFTPSSGSAKTLSYSKSGDTVTIGAWYGGSASAYTKVTAGTGKGFTVDNVNGGSSEATSTLTIITQSAATGLTASGIDFTNTASSSLQMALSVPAKGTLTEVTGSQGHVWRLGVTPTDMGWIRVGITNSNVDTGTKSAAIYKPGATIPYAVNLNSAKTTLSLGFFAGVEGLATGDITLTGATAGTLTDRYPSLGHKTWELSVSGATSPVTVKVTKSGVDPAVHTVN